MKLWASVDDSDLFDQYKRGGYLLIDLNAIVETRRKDVARIVSNLGGNGSSGVNKENLVPENHSIQKALQIIYHASNPRRRNPAMIGDFNGTYYNNPREMLKAAQYYLAQVYGGDFLISGTFSGVDRGRWDKINTPYGEFINGNRNRKETAAPYGKIVSDMGGVHLGDAVEYAGKKAVVINASHRHGGLGKGTARIEIKYLDGTTEIVVPWSLKKIQ